MARYFKNINGWRIEVRASINQLIETSGAALCPRPDDIYRALEMTAPQDTKVVILGQDPYHSIANSGIRKANGLAFGYNSAWIGSIDSSLLNIANELSASGWVLEDFTLESWAKQGVLLLNAALTTEQSSPGLHQEMWAEPVKEILQQVPRDAIFLLWGVKAQSLWANAGGTGIPISTSHPSYYSHDKGRFPFTGSRCFTTANEFLEQQGKEPVQWGLVKKVLTD